MDARLFDFRSLPRPVIASFVLLIVMIAGSIGIALFLSANTTRAGAIAEYRRAISDATWTLRTMESSQRGYLLTGEPSFLRLYRELNTEIDGRIDSLPAQLPERGATVRTELLPLFAAKRREMIATLERPRAEAIAIVRSGVGETMMLRIREVTMRERDWASAEVASLVAESRLALKLLTIGLVIGALAIALLSLFWMRQTRRAYNVVEAARADAVASLAALKDETEARDRAEAQVRQLQRMESLGQLTGGIAHDFNNMLAVVMGGIELARKKLSSDPMRADTLLENAREGAQRAATLTARLLAFSRNQPLAPAPLDVNKLVGGMCDMLNRTLGDTIEVECVYAAGLWRCYADPNEVENVILNLAINARDAMPGGGKLTVETANAYVDADYARTRGDVIEGQYVLVCVSDTGTGMPPEVVDKAFEPFFTTKEVGKGTGLGLSQVFGFAKQSGGHVAIYSEVGQGTTVKLYLPRFLGTETVAASSGPSIDIPEGRPGEIVLVVEDEQRVRHFAVDALRELGYTAISASNPREALVALDEQPEITLLFTDIVMPEMTGRQLADAARAKRPGLPILFTTGYTRNAVVHNGMVDIGVALLAKPYGLGELARKVRDVIDGGGINRQL
jgi:signal transduction histidine kinase/CheY-like chemotaxis protein